MATFAWIVMTAAQAAEAVTLNYGDASVDPRKVDNPQANDLGEGVLVGKSVLPSRLLSDPSYARWNATLGAMPVRMMDSDVLFIPSPED